MPLLPFLGPSSRSRLGPRLLAAILVASTGLTLLATAAQLYLDYWRDRNAIETTLQQIERTHVDSLALNLWTLDLRQVQLQLNGLVELSDVRYVEVLALAGERLTAGRPVLDRKLERSYPLRLDGAEPNPLGSLRVEVDMSAVYARLWARLWIILATQAAKTLLVALFILFVVDRWITRHLRAMASHAAQLSLDTLNRPLALERPPRTHPDELDAVVTALNDTSRSLAAEIEHRVEVEQASRAKSAFLASMNHELRTPLNAILGYAQLLQMDEALSPKQRRGADTILASGHHLMGLINDVLDHARIEAGRLQLQPADVGLEALLEAVVAQVQPAADAKGLAVVTDLDAELPDCLHVDAAALSRVLSHLLSNAVKFTEQGEVWVRAQQLARTGAQARIVFSVQDSGVGIAPADISRLFQPFERAKGAERRAAGAGLGLAISHQIVRALGGDILVDSVLGGGSRFSFELVLPVVEAGPTVVK